VHSRRAWRGNVLRADESDREAISSGNISQGNALIGRVIDERVISALGIALPQTIVFWPLLPFIKGSYWPNAVCCEQGD
jgi:hypothetical protein